MKKFLKLIPVLTFFCIFIAGVIGLLVPFDFENFSYGKIESKSGQVLTLNVDAKDNFEDVNIVIELTYKMGFSSSKDDQIEINSINLYKGKNEIEFENKIAYIPKVKSVKLTLNNGNTFYIYNNTFFSGINWTFICLIIVGFFGCAICYGISKSKKKDIEIETKNRKSFNERIKEAFSPVADTINTLKKTYEESQRKVYNEEKIKRVTCPYCKGKYNSNEDRCPHCGAPPEPCD